MYLSYSLLIWGSYLFLCLFLYQSSSPHSCEREKVASPFTEGTRTSFLYKEKKHSEVKEDKQNTVEYK